MVTNSSRGCYGVKAIRLLFYVHGSYDVQLNGAWIVWPTRGAARVVWAVGGAEWPFHGSIGYMEPPRPATMGLMRQRTTFCEMVVARWVWAAMPASTYTSTQLAPSRMNDFSIPRGGEGASRYGPANGSIGGSETCKTCRCFLRIRGP